MEYIMYIVSFAHGFWSLGGAVIPYILLYIAFLSINP